MSPEWGTTHETLVENLGSIVYSCEPPIYAEEFVGYLMEWICRHMNIIKTGWGMKDYRIDTISYEEAFHFLRSCIAEVEYEKKICYNCPLTDIDMLITSAVWGLDEAGVVFSRKTDPQETLSKESTNAVEAGQ